MRDLSLRRVTSYKATQGCRAGSRFQYKRIIVECFPTKSIAEVLERKHLSVIIVSQSYDFDRKTSFSTREQRYLGAIPAKCQKSVPAPSLSAEIKSRWKIRFFAILPTVPCPIRNLLQVKTGEFIEKFLRCSNERTVLVGNHHYRNAAWWKCCWGGKIRSEQQIHLRIRRN